MHVRKRSGSGDVFVEGGGGGGVHSRSSSGVFGYGSIGMSDRSGGDGSYGGGGGVRGGMHARTKSDMSFSSAVTDLTKSALVREITEGGRIRFQLPKDNFRILMDCSLGEFRLLCCHCCCLVVVSVGLTVCYHCREAAVVVLAPHL